MPPGSLQTMIFGPLVVNQSCEASSCKQVVWVWEVIARNLVVVVVLITQLDKEPAGTDSWIQVQPDVAAPLGDGMSHN